MAVVASADIPSKVREALVHAASSTTPRRFLAALNTTGLINSGDSQIASLRQSALHQLGIPNECLPSASADSQGDVGKPAEHARILARNLRALHPSVRSDVGSPPPGTRCFAARDGGRVIACASGMWYALAAVPSEVEIWVSKLRAEQGSFPGPFLVSGFSNPEVLKAVFRASANADSYHPRIDVIEPDASIAAIGLGCEDLTPIIEDPRVHWHIGREAVERHLRDMESRVDDALPGAILPSECLPTPDDSRLQTRLQALHIRQRDELMCVRTRIEALYAPRDRNWWIRRFSTQERKVLFFSSRHTTFIRHSIQDLANAMRASGAQVHIVEESDSQSKLTALHYARAVVNHEPDIVISANYPRSTFRAAIPSQVPFVCWIQDAMTHLFDAAQGRACSEYDFFAGYLFPELFERYGYPAKRILNCTLVADESKFRRSEARSDAFACELAMVNHHGESPRRLHESLKSRFDTIPGAGRFLDQLFDRIGSAVSIASAAFVDDEILIAIRDCAEIHFGHALDQPTIDRIARQYAHPIADRIFRHDTVSWAAALADRRGWRLKLYGRGWEQHEQFHRYAAGVLAHGEELRDAYRNAALQLHASIAALAHQRVMECALAGGLCLPRLHREMLRGTLREMRLQLLRHEPDSVDRVTGDLVYRAANRRELAEFLSMWSRLGETSESDRLTIPRQEAAELERRRAWLERDADPNLIFGDLAVNTFRDRESFESLAIRAVEDPGWRQEQSDMIANRVREGYTHRVFAKNVFELVGREFGG